MKRFFPLFLSAGLCAAFVPAGRAQAGPPDMETRLAALRAQVVNAAATVDKEMAKPNPEPEIRHLAAAGWCHLALGDDPKKGEEYLRKVFSLQDMDPASPEYGTWAWRIGHTEVKDANAIDFAVSFFVPALLRYPDSLSEDFKREAQPHLKAAIFAERRHKVAVTYGNIYLMKLSNLIMLGELTGDVSAVDEGRAMLKEWLAWTRVNGDNEYDSPTYTPVQMTGLEHVYIHAPDEATRQLAKAGLDYLWSDIAANYFAPRDSLGGPHSRSYDFLYQQGSLQRHYYLEGLSPELVGKESLGSPWLNVICKGCYRPAGSILALARIPERTIEQRYGAEPGRDRHNRITPDFDVGCSSTYYGPQDEQIAVEFASAKKLPVTWVVLDTIDAPYGKQRTKDKSGHDKPRHTRDVIAAVQSGGRVLALHDLSPDLMHGKYESVGTNIIIPMMADAVYIDDTPVPAGQVGKTFEQTVGRDTTVFVREGKTMAAFRLFDATGMEGQTPKFALKYDGNEWGAGRLVVYHYQGKETGFEHDTTPLSGVYLCVERCDGDKAFAEFRQRERAVKIESKHEGRQWSAAVGAGDKRLEAALDVPNHQIAYRRVGGQPVQPHTFTVNGRDLAAEILDAYKSAPTPATAAR